MSKINYSKLEQEAGRKAALILRKSIKGVISESFETTQGNSKILRSTVLSKMKGPELQRLTIKMPHYGFKNNFGFDGIKKNGVALKLLSNKGFINKAITANNALENLATEIGNIRADLVTAKITF